MTRNLQIFKHVPHLNTYLYNNTIWLTCRFITNTSVCDNCSQKSYPNYLNCYWLIKINLLIWEGIYNISDILINHYIIYLGSRLYFLLILSMYTEKNIDGNNKNMTLSRVNNKYLVRGIFYSKINNVPS